MRGIRWWVAVAIVAIAGGSFGVRVRTQSSTAPVLLIVNSASPNPFGPYLGEILKAEGLNSFSVAQLSTVTPSSLADVRVAVLAETPLTDAQAVILGNFVAGGGGLVAMRPDARLASTLRRDAAWHVHDRRLSRHQHEHVDRRGIPNADPADPWNRAAQHAGCGRHHAGNLVLERDDADCLSGCAQERQGSDMVVRPRAQRGVRAPGQSRQCRR